MKRIILMVVTNLFFVIVCWPKLCRMAAHPERYTKEERWKHLQFWVERACKGGRIVLEAHGQEKLPEEPFILYPNHQGMFDVLAIAGTCDHFLGVVNKKEVRNFLLLKQVFQITGSLSMDREDIRQHDCGKPGGLQLYLGKLLYGGGSDQRIRSDDFCETAKRPVPQIYGDPSAARLYAGNDETARGTVRADFCRGTGCRHAWQCNGDE